MIHQRTMLKALAALAVLACVALLFVVNPLAPVNLENREVPAAATSELPAEPSGKMQTNCDREAHVSRNSERELELPDTEMVELHVIPFYSDPYSQPCYDRTAPMPPHSRRFVPLPPSWLVPEIDFTSLLTPSFLTR